jgi:hypothetical protein
VVWETSDRICGKRLRPLIPILVEALEQWEHRERLTSLWFASEQGTKLHKNLTQKPVA